MFLFLRGFWFLLDLVVRLLPSCVVSRFSLLAWGIFLCQIPFLYRLYILAVYIRVSNSFSFLAKFEVINVHQVVDLFCDLLSLHPVVHFQRMWLSGIAITNINSDSASPWNMLLWIFTSAKLFLPTVNFTLKISKVFSINCTIWKSILYILRQYNIQVCETILSAF